MGERMRKMRKGWSWMRMVLVRGILHKLLVEGLQNIANTSLLAALLGVYHAVDR